MKDMKSFRKPSTAVTRAGFIASLIAVTAVSALAQTTGSTTGSTGGSPLDYTTALTGAKTDLGTVFSTNGALFLGLLIVALGFGIAWRLLKRAAKAV